MPGLKIRREEQPIVLMLTAKPLFSLFSDIFMACFKRKRSDNAIDERFGARLQVLVMIIETTCVVDGHLWRQGEQKVGRRALPLGLNVPDRVGKGTKDGSALILHENHGGARVGVERVFESVPRQSIFLTGKEALPMGRLGDGTVQKVDLLWMRE